MTAEASRQRWSEPEIDFSTFPGKDGKPMADTERNQREMINIMFALRQPLEPQGHHVGGNLIIYYNPENGLDHLSPDVFVALDRDAGMRESWKTWLEGKFPEVVVEIASPSTQQRDIGEKRARYGALGAREYYIHDPARRLQPAFRGYRAARGALLPVPNPSGLSTSQRGARAGAPGGGRLAAGDRPRQRQALPHAGGDAGPAAHGRAGPP